MNPEEKLIMNIRKRFGCNVKIYRNTIGTVRGNDLSVPIEIQGVNYAYVVVVGAKSLKQEDQDNILAIIKNNLEPLYQYWE